MFTYRISTKLRTILTALALALSIAGSAAFTSSAAAMPRQDYCDELFNRANHYRWLADRYMSNYFTPYGAWREPWAYDEWKYDVAQVRQAEASMDRHGC